MRYRRDTEERACGKVIDLERWAEYGGLACLRTAGHPGDCIAMAGDAGRADGVCWECRVPEGASHRTDCHSGNK